MNELGRRESSVFGINRGAGDSQFLGRFVDRNIHQHDHFMGKEDTKIRRDKNNQFVTVEHLELSPIHLPGGLFP
ncbi:MAG: hypothetical protein AUK23_00845 [Deltaproteobacteria bacterium CG2_30_43_15]|nr:MAG: hypothetical protein AUK23_07430 [Deltaproteobacteria bacterium CG2_30_43_15]OIP31363.1 MAG: hypothetical protein AUK23_07065 [Deltaproteobacteria bacterium CG2_30_43_15]OIP31994.1 MAG: hypothetical protein AUK23_05510 [Deltaproteobacteria bacterium CG2_30_43_15]OIP33047.1 MAG: hypothetical protein AUK23_03490 [Deltaproteobacteria bacterium CG2_30_43_15]OIP35134.1 MAG: hypothetical protein AUK23_00845 [Deltaproteobacteria bacterium CG2_30_43_15]